MAGPTIEPGPIPPSDVPPPETAAEWLKVETERFKAYVAEELARLEKCRLENAEAESRHEAACISRSMELNRLTAMLESQHATLKRRESELQQANDGLAARLAECDRRTAELNKREAASAAREQQKARLQSEAAELSRLVSELRPTVEKLELRKTEAQGIRAKILSRQSSLDRRLIEVGRTELALQKRMAELKETEQTMRREFEVQEVELERQRTMLKEVFRSLRKELPGGIVPQGSRQPVRPRATQSAPRVPINIQTPPPQKMEELSAPSDLPRGQRN